MQDCLAIKGGKNMDMRQDCEQIVKNALDQVRPDGAVCRALAEEHFGYGRLILVAAGKAAWWS